MGWRTLRAKGLYPYHIQRVRHLKPEDLESSLLRIDLSKNREEPEFVEKKTRFTRDGVVNSHHPHTWSDENSHTIQERNFQERFSINV